MSQDILKKILFISLIVVGIIDALYLIFSIVFFALVMAHVIVVGEIFIYISIAIIVLNIIECIFLPIYIKFRKD